MTINYNGALVFDRPWKTNCPLMRQFVRVVTDTKNVVPYIGRGGAYYILIYIYI